MKPRIKSVIWKIRKQKQPIRTRRRKKNPKNEDSIKSIWDNFRRPNIHITGAAEGEEKKQEVGNLSEKIVKENFPNLAKETDMQIQEVQRVPIMMDAKRSTPRHVIIKRPKVKDKEGLLKARAKKLVTSRFQIGGGRDRMGKEMRGLTSTTR